MIWHLYVRAAAACDRDSVASIDANRPVLRSEERKGIHRDPEGEQRRTPFVPLTSLRPATCQTVPLHSPLSEYKQRAGYTES